MKKIIIFFSILFLCVQEGFSQEIWKKTYPFEGGGEAESIKKTGDGGFILSGKIFSKEFDSDGLLMKIDSSGELKWFKTYGGEGMDGFSYAEETKDGGFIACGTTFFSPITSKIYVVKTDSKGNMLWEKLIGEEGFYEANVIREIKGGYIIAGSTNRDAHGSRDVFLIKIDKIGNILWSKNFGGDLIDIGVHAEVSGKNLYIAGFTSSFTSKGADAYLLKTNLDGKMKWEKFYEFSGIEIITSMDRTERGFVLAGYTEYPVKGSYGKGIYVMTVKENGELVWNKVFEGERKMRAYSVKSAGKNILLGGVISSPDEKNWDPYLLMLDEYGDILWEYVFEGEANEMINDVEKTEDGFYFAGFSKPRNGKKEVLLGFLPWREEKGERASPYIFILLFLGVTGAFTLFLGLYIYMMRNKKKEK